MEHRRKKISVIGAGFVGSTCAHWIAAKELADVVILDINEGAAKGKALDLAQAGPVEGFDAKIIGTANYKDTAGSDVVIITAGLPRKPGMSRDDLLSTNAKIMKDVCTGLREFCPNAFVIVVSNPLDAMTYVAYETMKMPKNRIMGMAGVLDTARFKMFISEELNVSVEDIQAIVLGGHGDTMVPMPRHTLVGGVPLTELMPKEKLEALIQRTRTGGAEIVGLLKTGSAYYAPSASAVQMAETILKDKKRIIPCAALCEGEYGYKNLFVGVPALIGGSGVEKIIEMKLNDEEKRMLDSSAAAVKDLVEALKKLS